MRILWVKAGKLLPVDTGGKLRSYRILKELAREHAVVLLSYYNGRRDEQYESTVRAELPGAQCICTNVADADVVAESLHYARRFFGGAPFAVSKFAHPEVRRAATACLKDGQFDIAVCDFLAASMNFPGGFATPVVLFQHNVETVLWQRLRSTEPNPVKRLVCGIEASRMKQYETAALRKFQHVIAVSERDQQEMLAMAPGCAITVVPTGADAQNQPRPATTAVHDAPKIVFVGSMDWEPNIDGVEYFCREIFPGVQTEFPKAVFQIVGRKPVAKVRGLASRSVEVTGTVASVEEYWREATLTVVPLRIGGGTRLKIFEAMARGKAVVSTTIGAEGLDVQPGRDLILADDPRSFSEAVRGLLRDSALRRKFELQAVACAGQHDWSRVAKRFADVLERTAETAQAARKSRQPLVAV